MNKITEYVEAFKKELYHTLFLLIIIKSGLLAEIWWSVCM